MMGGAAEAGLIDDDGIVDLNNINTAEAGDDLETLGEGGAS